MNLENAIYATLALGGGPFLFWRGFRDLRLKRVIEDTPTANIRSMAMGFVELKGQVSPRSHQAAPFSGQPCAYWEVDISTQRGRRGGWQVIHRAQSHQPFYLQDETGVALVYPGGAQCKVSFGREEVCSGLALPEPYASYLKEHGSVGLTLSRIGMLRFRERLIEEGQAVYVLGSAFPRAQAVDLSGEEAFAATGTEHSAALRLQMIDKEVAGVIRKGQNDPTFVISQESERALVTGLGLRSIGQLVAGPALALFGLAYWLGVLEKAVRPR